MHNSYLYILYPNSIIATLPLHFLIIGLSKSLLVIDSTPSYSTRGDALYTLF